MNTHSATDGGVGEQSPTGLELVIRLYEGAQNFFAQAGEACDAGRIDEFKEKLQRGRRIIEELQRTLDFQQGGEVARQLDELYRFILDQTSQSELLHESAPLGVAGQLLTTLLDGWRGIRQETGG